MTSSPTHISTLLPPLQRQRLVLAAAVGDIEEIDRVTDELAAMGLCRPRSAIARGFKVIPRETPTGPVDE